MLSSEAFEVLGRLKGALRCSHGPCGKLLENPTTLPCAHTMCKECMLDSTGAPIYGCSLCNRPCYIKDCYDNLHMSRIIELSTKLFSTADRIKQIQDKKAMQQASAGAVPNTAPVRAAATKKAKKKKDSCESRSLVTSDAKPVRGIMKMSSATGSEAHRDDSNCQQTGEHDNGQGALNSLATGAIPPPPGPSAAESAGKGSAAPVVASGPFAASAAVVGNVEGTAAAADASPPGHVSMELNEASTGLSFHGGSTPPSQKSKPVSRVTATKAVAPPASAAAAHLAIDPVTHAVYRRRSSGATGGAATRGEVAGGSGGLSLPGVPQSLAAPHVPSIYGGRSATGAGTAGDVGKDTADSAAVAAALALHHQQQQVQLQRPAAAYIATLPPSQSQDHLAMQQQQQQHGGSATAAASAQMQNRQHNDTTASSISASQAFNIGAAVSAAAAAVVAAGGAAVAVSSGEARAPHAQQAAQPAAAPDTLWISSFPGNSATGTGSAASSSAAAAASSPPVAAAAALAARGGSGGDASAVSSVTAASSSAASSTGWNYAFAATGPMPATPVMVQNRHQQLHVQPAAAGAGASAASASAATGPSPGSLRRQRDEEDDDDDDGPIAPTKRKQVSKAGTATAGADGATPASALASTKVTPPSKSSSSAAAVPALMPGAGGPVTMTAAAFFGGGGAGGKASAATAGSKAGTPAATSSSSPPSSAPYAPRHGLGGWKRAEQTGKLVICSSGLTDQRDKQLLKELVKLFGRGSKVVDDFDAETVTHLVVLGETWVPSGAGDGGTAGAGAATGGAAAGPAAASVGASASAAITSGADRPTHAGNDGGDKLNNTSDPDPAGVPDGDPVNVAAAKPVLICMRTLKYVQAVLCGCWVVDISWVRQCIASRSHVPESDYEITCDKHKKKEGMTKAPALGRQMAAERKPHPLHGTKVFVLEPLYRMQSQDLVDALRCAAVKVVAIDPRQSGDKSVIIITTCDPGLRDKSSMAKLRSEYVDKEFTVVDQMWFLDSVSGWRVWDTAPWGVGGESTRKMYSGKLKGSGAGAGKGGDAGGGKK